MDEEILDLLHDFGGTGEVVLFYLNLVALFGRKASDDFKRFGGVVHGCGDGFVGAHTGVSRLKGMVAV